jgi:steroid delta-isomerase-like uncharacterized protein
LTPEQIAIHWISAYNAHDVAAATALYDENVTNLQLPWGKTVQGREAMRGVYLKIFQAFPDIRIEAENIVEEGGAVVVEWRFGGTMRGEFAGHAPTGRAFDMRGCEVFRVHDGKIREQRGYWDKATMFAQLGIGAGA